MTIQKSDKKPLLKMLDTGNPFLFTRFARPVTSLITVILLAIASTVNLAQPDNNVSSRDVTPEEITVYAEMSLRKLRLETNRAREAMFNVFNDLNSDDRFDIQCEYVQRWQSKIREYECSPAYLKNAREQEVNLFLRSIGGEDGGFAGGQGGGAGVSQMDYFNALLKKEMDSVFQENAEFREAMNNYNVVQEIYDSRLGD